MSERDRLTDALRSLVGEPSPHLEIYRARTVDQGIDKRVTLRLVDRDREMSDSKPVSVWWGVPGVSAKLPNGSELALSFYRADPTQAFAMLATPYGQPTHVPDEVAHDARTEIRLLGAAESVTAKVYVGPTPTFKVALGDQTAQALTALSTAFDAVKIYANAVAALGGPFAATAAAAAALETAIGALESALTPLLGTAPTGLIATKLESA